MFVNLEVFDQKYLSKAICLGESYKKEILKIFLFENCCLSQVKILLKPLLVGPRGIKCQTLVSKNEDLFWTGTVHISVCNFPKLFSATTVTVIV